MRRKILFFLLGMMLCILFQTCKSPGTPEPIKTSDILEFLYQRVKPIVAPNETDPRGFNIFSHAEGGIHASGWHKVAENKWMAEAELRYHVKTPYVVSVVDGKVAIGYEEQGRRIFVRIKGQSEWIELTHVTATYWGEEAEFILDAEGIHAVF